MRSVEAHKGRRLNRIQGWCIMAGIWPQMEGTRNGGGGMELDVTGEDWGKKKDIFRLTFQKPLSFWGNMGEDVEI